MEVLLSGWGQAGQTDTAGLIPQGLSRNREICSQPIRSLSSAWDLGILEWKFEALNWRKKSNFHSGVFSGYPI